MMAEQIIQAQDLVRRLLERYPSDRAGETLDKESLLAALAAADDSREPLLTRVQSSGNPGVPAKKPGAQEAALLSWVDNAFRIMLCEYSLDDLITARLRRLLPAVAAVALVEGGFLDIGKHPLQRLLDTIYSGCLGWHARLGRAGQALLAELDKTIEAIERHLSAPEQDFNELLDRFGDFLDAEQTAVRRMRERVIASEQGKLKASSARITAGQALNELMEGHQFSSALTDFMIGPWYDSMQLMLITAGPDSKEWERMLKVTRTLVWTVQPADFADENERQRLYKLIPLIPRELEDLLVSLQRETGERKQAIAAVEDMHFRLLRNRPPSIKPFEPILLGPGNARTSVTEHMLAQIKQLDVGEWFKVSMEDGPNLRVQLALKMDEYHQLLFVNRAGVKALQKTFEEFAYLLSSGVARPCHALPAFTVSLLRAAGMEEEAASASAGRAGGSQAPRLSPRVRELKKRLAEQREAASKDEQPLSIAIGSWVNFSDGESPQLFKLAARIDGLDKWLFVNNRGVKQRELNSEQLTALQKAGYCEVVTSESRFEQTVENVVRNLRNQGKIGD